VNPKENSQINSVIEYLQQNYLHVENEFTEPVYREVIYGFLSESDNIQKAASKTFDVYNLLHTYRITLHREITGYPEFDWDDRKKQAVEYLDKASELLDDPLSGTDFYEVSKYLADPDKCQLFKDKGMSMPGRINNKNDIEMLAELDILAIVIWRIALALEETPVEKIIPYHARNPLYKRQGYLADDTSKRGVKSSKSVFIRRLDRALSDNTNNKAAVISKLTNMAIHTLRKKGYSVFVPEEPVPIEKQLDKLYENKEVVDMLDSGTLTKDEQIEYLASLLDFSTIANDHKKITHRYVSSVLKGKPKKASKTEMIVKDFLRCRRLKSR